LSGAPLTDDGLARLRGLSNLRALHANLVSITDVGVAHMRSFANLEELSMLRTPIGDAAVAHLNQQRTSLLS
jgi:hypothetical protein